MVGITLSKKSTAQTDGLRPINFRTDLAPLADLIEVAFVDAMNPDGRAAVREMRTLSKMGVGLSVLAGMNELAQGVNLGYVWIADGKLVGNVSIYGTRWPAEFGSAWIIANVAVHPDYRERGLATRLMQAAKDAICERGGSTAILQVDADNDVALRLYERVGFAQERTWIQWARRGGQLPATPAPNSPVRVGRRRRGEWRAEYALAQRVRPRAQGGLGWLQPLHPGLFQQSLWRRVLGILSLQKTRYMVARPHGDDQLLGSLWAKKTLGASKTTLRLMTEPEYLGVADEALLNWATRHYSYRPLVFDHPQDEEATGEILRRYRFRPRRTIVNMRWDAR